jgi:class 3 adenylate cyclase
LSDAVRPALAIQDDVASFNSTRGGGASATPIVLKLGLHAGPCIAVTTGDALDYFGATVNIAARLERQCRGCEVIVSEAAAKDAETAATLADRTRLEETATLRGVSAPVRFLRVAVGDITDRVRPAPKGHKGRPTFDGP